jgi:hypothetical protein
MSWLQGPAGKLRRHGERNGDQNRKRLGLSHRKTSFDARNRQVRAARDCSVVMPEHSLTAVAVCSFQFLH